MSDNTFISFDVDDLEECRRALSQLANAVWRHHGLATTEQLLTRCTFASKAGLRRGKNFRLLRALHDSRLSVERFAAETAKKNKSLAWDYRYGTGSTNAKTIARQIRRLKSDPKYRRFLSGLAADNS